MRTSRSILLALAVAISVATAALAQKPEPKPEPWFLTVTHRIDLQPSAVGARFVNHLSAGFLIDASGHVVTRLVNLDPLAVEKKIRVTTTTGRILDAAFVGLDAPTGLAILYVPELQGVKPIPIDETPALDEGATVTILSPEYKLKQIPAPIERVAIPPALESSKGRVAISKTDASLALSGVRFVVESPNLTSSRDLSILEAPDGTIAGLVKYFSPTVGQVLGLTFLRDVVAKRVVASNGNVAAGWLGAEFVSSGDGVRIAAVAPEGPAALGGLRRDDVVVGFAEFAVRSWPELANAVSSTPAGTTISLKVRRGDETVTLTPVLGARPFVPGQPVFTQESVLRQAQYMQMYLATLQRDLSRAKSPEDRAKVQAEIDLVLGRPAAPPPAPAAEVNLRTIGLVVYDLTKQLAEIYRVEGGVLVASVQAESVAATAGLQANDVIVAVNGSPVTDEATLRGGLRVAVEAGAATAELTVFRKDASTKVSISVEPLRR